MKKEAKDNHFLKTPVYHGGLKAMRQFIREHLQYPEEALENRIEGTVYVRYDINYKGEVIDASVIKGIGHGCDEEAVRLTKLLRFEVPKNRGLRVLFHKNIQIHFKMPERKKVQPDTVIQYSLVGKKQEDKKGTGYTYTINL